MPALDIQLCTIRGQQLHPSRAQCFDIRFKLRSDRLWKCGVLLLGGAPAFVVGSHAGKQRHGLWKCTGQGTIKWQCNALEETLLHHRDPRFFAVHEEGNRKGQDLLTVALCEELSLQASPPFQMCLPTKGEVPQVCTLQCQLQ